MFAIVLMLHADLSACAAEQTPDQELQNLRQRLEAQEREMERQRAEIEALKTAMQHLIEGSKPGSDCQQQNCGQTAGVAQDAQAPQTNPQVTSAVATAEQNAPRRFSLGGDVRVRFEPIIQDLTPTRYRTRLRVRFGMDATLNQDFKAAFYLASGALDDPVSTNVTLTQFFTRKPIAIDRGWISYHPASHDWLEVTGGKFTPGWQRTSVSLDPDLNPEGLQQKLSFSIKNPVLKKVSVSGMQLIFNELPGTLVPFSSGSDSYAFGGQLGAQFQFGNRVTTSFYGSAINWQNTDSVIQAITAGALAGNRNTNATITTGTDVRYASKFLYADTIADTLIDTGLERWPIRVTLNFLDNPRAASNQRQAFWSELALGQLDNRNDLAFGYAFGRIEQDAVIAAFNESELRAPTNVLQHRLLFQWQAEKNTTFSFTSWIGRTLDRRLQNAALPPGLPADAVDPWVKRLQLDLIYKF